MTLPAEFLELLEPDAWPLLRQKIIKERERRMEDLLHIPTLEAMRTQQGFIAALDWVIEESKPKKRRDDDDE